MNKDDYLTLYITPDIAKILQGEKFGVSYTAINRRGQTESVWLVSRIVTPAGNPYNILGPDHYSLPKGSPWEDTCYQCHRREAYTVQFDVVHYVPEWLPLGEYQYKSFIGVPPLTLYDIDKFFFEVRNDSVSNTRECLTRR